MTRDEEQTIDLLAFGFQLGGGLGAIFLGCPKSRLIRHEPPLPFRQSLTPMRSKLYTWGALVGKLVPSLPWSPRLAPWAYVQKWLAMTSPKQPVIGRIPGLQWNRPFRTDSQDWGVPSASALIIRTLKELRRDIKKKKKKNITHVKIPHLRRLSTLSDRCGTDLATSGT